MRKKGFTIIELLVVISIIVLLIGIMTPGARKAKQLAMKVKQKAQLRNVSIGVELWSNEHGNDYPESTTTGNVLFTTGAHHLAEALVGRDGYGFDSISSWDAELDAAIVSPTPIPYDPTILSYTNREPVYLDSGVVDNFQLAQIYGDSSFTGDAYPGDYNADGTATIGEYPAGVFTDIYKKQRVTMSTTLANTVKVGSPILYFKAKDTNVYDPTFPNSSIFNYNDNIDIFALGLCTDATQIHPFYDATGISPAFYASLVNPTITYTGDPVPYNKHTFVLLSAGFDGLYGTKDDVTNISE